VIQVPAFTGLKIHDITTGPGDPNREPLDQNQPAGSPAFFAGNGRFLTRKLWRIANQHPFMHHGQFTTIRHAVLAHSGKTLAWRTASQSPDSLRSEFDYRILEVSRIFTNQVGSLCEDEDVERIDCPPGIDPYQ
jgi:hypothetical protein